MDTQQAIDIIKALRTIGSALDMEWSEVGQMVSLLKKENLTILNQAVDLNNKFNNADIVERGRLLGIDIIQRSDGGHEASVVLSGS